MNLIDLLTSPITALPNAGSSDDFSKFYKQFTDQYFDLLGTVSPVGNIDKAFLDNKDASLDIRNSIHEALELYLSGRPSAAYLRLKETVVKHEQIFKNVVAEPRTEKLNKNLFRIRESKGEKLTKDDLFHIPFRLRRKVSSQRYSIPGFPSLYLSSSIYTAWKELSSPDLDSVVVVRVELTQKVKVLDLGHPPQFLAPIISQFNSSLQLSGMLFDLLTAKLILWPLQAACSVMVYDRNSPFKPEYIIPQLILQLLRDDAFGTDIQGIRYFSMNYGQSKHSLDLGTNYVFPVKDTFIDGHCEMLKELTLLTEPLPWSVANLMTDGVEVLHVKDDVVELSPGFIVPYKSTKFAQVESMLISQVAAKL